MKKKLALFLAMLFCTATIAADLPRIAVYVTGNVPENEKNALGTVMLSTLINSGRYRGIERSAAFLAEIDREQERQRSGAIDDSQISELGRQFGVKFVCIAAIIPAFGSYMVSARIVDVESAEVVFIGQASSPLQSMADLTQASDEVVNIMFRGQVAQRAETIPQPIHAPTLTPAPAAPLKPAAKKPALTAGDVMEEGGGQEMGRGKQTSGADAYLALRVIPTAPPAYSFAALSGNIEWGGFGERGRF